MVLVYQKNNSHVNPRMIQYTYALAAKFAVRFNYLKPWMSVNELKEELASINQISLARALKNYNPNLGVTESTYVHKVLANGMLSWLTIRTKHNKLQVKQVPLN